MNLNKFSIVSIMLLISVYSISCGVVDTAKQFIMPNDSNIATAF
jgi:hypothetical protein